TPWDCNFPYGPPPSAVPPNQPAPTTDNPKKDPCEGQGSVIEFQNQIMRQDIALVGTPIGLHYASDRVPGRKAAHTLNIKMSGATVPPNVRGFELEVSVAGQL